MTTQPMTTPQAATPNLADGAAALAQYGKAIRGAWWIDGRSVRGDLDDIGDVYAGTLTLERFRDRAGLCAHGDGHWSDYCDDDCAAATEDQP